MTIKKEVKEQVLAIARQTGDNAKTIAETLPRKSASYRSVVQILKENGIELVRGPRPDQLQKRDMLIKEGKTLQEIANTDGTTRENIRLYIQRTGQYQQWQEAREFQSSRSRERMYQDIGSLLNDVLLKKAQETGWAYEQAVKYQLSLKQPNRPTALPFATLVSFFAHYDRARKSDKQLNLRELGEMVRTDAMTARRLLQIAGLPNFNPQRRSRLPSHVVNSLEKAFGLEWLSQKDIAYFLGVSKITVGKYFLGGRQERKNNNVPSYSNASQIYEAIDAGFTNEETAEYINMPQTYVQLTLNQRPQLERKIKKALKILRPELQITKPYLPARTQ